MNRLVIKSNNRVILRLNDSNAFCELLDSEGYVFLGQDNHEIIKDKYDNIIGKMTYSDYLDEININ